MTTVLLVIASSSVVLYNSASLEWNQRKRQVHVPINAAEIVHKCNSLNILPGPPKNFHSRSQSDRFQPGTQPTLIKNATLWTGRSEGHEVLSGSLLLDKGIIKAVGNIEQAVIDAYDNLNVIEAHGAWVTPGIVDVHSHIGVDSIPELKGSDDTNSFKGLVLPWLRSLDGLNTHDESYRLSISGGVTTVNVLPGSADAIGGQAFTIKLRSTAERSPSSMVLEPPHNLNGTHIDPSLPPRWRQMKHACGENPSGVYQGTRMDTQWAFREGYNTARQVKDKQDAYCSKALSGDWQDLGEFPDDLQWEALVDVLRGRVKVHNHCYEAVDLDNMVRLTNEFKFSIAAFHHAHETYLVPDLLKKAYGKTPAVALFATNARYKREAYRGSEFAPRILSDHGLQVVMKSDHPVLNSRHVLYEAQQAHYYGLPSNLALASVTSTSATILGYDHRIGYLKEGHDADVAIWDSHPLTLGAAPTQVLIDGIAQLEKPFVVKKPSESQKVPETPNFDEDAKEAVKYDGLPPLEPKKAKAEVVIFNNVSEIFIRKAGKVEAAYMAKEANLRSDSVAVAVHGELVCFGVADECGLAQYGADVQHIDLEGGSISPSLLSYGAPLGLVHIDAEASANDGSAANPLDDDQPKLLGPGSVIRAVDGLLFSSRDALLAYRAGVTTGISAPQTDGFLAGIGAAFGTGLPHRLAHGAVLQQETALHFDLISSKTSVSTQMAALRNLFVASGAKGELADRIERVLWHGVPLVVRVHSADIIATLLELKKEIENKHGTDIKLTIVGGAEAHLLAREIGKAGVGVILIPSRPFPTTWKSKRILPGPPLSQDSAISVLIAHGVIVGLGIEEQWSARHTRFDVGWAALEAGGDLSKSEAIALASVNLEQLLGLRDAVTDLVAVKQGTLFDFEGKVAGIISQQRGLVDMI
ncbi:carbohydrate esterase family 9 protein [Crepidotus variabilis]|uniref:Carbohydrate esterase family 9 protein n=1 Tax=Crepidotus variabilis TaxID=179855 RepID=A0A9P6E6V9_9AGAR|nr:carbohydrate esterase family 9 protein [Crepidotus variabilis]